jgi:hypothetical protein
VPPIRPRAARRTPFRALAALALAALLAGCDGDSTTPRVLGDLLIVSGDEQTAPVNTRLPEPLVVRVVDDTGDPIPGVHIAWEVAIGSGTVSSARTVTDRDGETSVEVVLTVGGQSGIFATIDEPILDLYQVVFVATGT